MVSIRDLVARRRATHPKFLGDGVYACYDGWQVWLDAPREDGIHSIALDPGVLNALLAYLRELKAELDAKKPEPTGGE
jgi:hypothetical protein